MQFKNDSHEKLFLKTIKGMNQRDNTQMALAFLLTADKKLWDCCRIYMISNEIPIHRIRPKCCSEKAYVLFCAAKDIALGTKYVSMNDLADKTLITPKLWKIIYNAMQIKRFGLSAVRT